MNKARRVALKLCLFLLASSVPLAWGQSSTVPQTLPGQQNPGLLTSPFQVPDSVRDRTSQKQKPMDEIKLELPDHKPEPPSGSSVTIPVNEIRVEGVTLFKADEIKPLLAPYVGKVQTLNQLDTLVASITNLYHQRGYLTTEAFIPPQDIVDGALTIRVQEGAAGKISVEGAHFYKARLVKNAVSQKPGELLNFRLLERDLNRVNRLNGSYYMVKAFMAAGERPGQTDIKIRVAERQPFQISGVTDNQGRPFIGLYRGGVDIRHDSLTGLGDKLHLMWRGAPNTQLGMASYTLPLNRFGTELSTSAAFSHVNIQLPVKNPPEIIGKSFTGSVTLSQPLDRERHLVADTSLMWSHVSSLFDGDRTSMTDVRALQTGLSYSRSDRFGNTFNRLQSTVAVGGIGGNAQFWKVENYFNRVFYLPKNNIVILRGYGQMTPDALPAAQQFQIGGENSVRGFTEGLLIGDRGVNFGIEHRFPIPCLSRVNPWLGSRLQMAWFYDYGHVWLDHSNHAYVKGISTTPQRSMLQSVGFGFRAQLTRFAQGFVDFGFGLGDRSMVEPLRVQPTARVHFGIRSDLLPDMYRMRPTMPVVYVPRPALKR